MDFDLGPILLFPFMFPEPMLGVTGAVSNFPRPAPPWVPTAEERFWAGICLLKNGDFGVTFDDPEGPLGHCWVIVW